jgi:signal transduction histidine kinase
MDTKGRAIASIEEARHALENALTELDSIPEFDPAVVGFVAHALTNYVTAITATLDMLKSTLCDYPDADVATWLEGIRHATDLMQHMIGRLLHASAPADFPLKPSHVNVRLLMERASQYYRRLAEPNQVAIVCLAASDIPLVWADRVAVAVVAENLLAYAVRISPSRSTIYVHITAEADGVVCSVRDAGPGLTRAQQDQLLQRMVDGTAPRGADPNGASGLALAWEFVDRMAGTLWLDSEPGKGTRFSFRLPTRA